VNHLITILSGSVVSYLIMLFIAHIFDNEDFKMKFTSCLLIQFVIEFVFVLIGYH